MLTTPTIEAPEVPRELNYPVECMKFRLTYEGPLPPDGTATQKQAVRRCFHPQLFRLFEVHPTLVQWAECHKAGLLSGVEVSKWWGFDFLPLVRADLNMVCGIDVLLLEPEPSSPLRRSDIDNRLKTLFDALRMPDQQGEVPPGDSPQQGESPFYVLLESDKLITSVKIEVDRLLVHRRGPSYSDVKAIVEVTAKSTRLDIFTAGINVD